MTEILNIPAWVLLSAMVAAALTGGISGFAIGRDVKQLRKVGQLQDRAARMEKEMEIITAASSLERELKEIAINTKEVAPENGGQGKGYGKNGNSGTGDSEFTPSGTGSVRREPIRKPSKKSGRR